MKEKIHSEITGYDYNPHEVVRLVNIRQICSYLQMNKKPVDIYASVDLKTNNPVLVVLFNREDTKDAYSRWCNSKNLWQELQNETSNIS